MNLKKLWIASLMLGFTFISGFVSHAQPGDCQLLSSGITIEGVSDPGPFEIHSTQYCIKVPAGALALQIDLESASGGDLDVFVSVDEAVDPTDLFFSSEYNQISDDKSEHLTIDQQSLPELTEGFYYIGVGNVDEAPTSFRLTATLRGSELRCVVSVQDEVFDKVITMVHDGKRIPISFGLRDDEVAIAEKIAQRVSLLEDLSVTLVGSSLLFSNADVELIAPFGIAIPCAQPGAPILTDLQVPAFHPGNINLQLLFSDLEADVAQVVVTLTINGRQYTVTRALSAEENAFGVASFAISRKDFRGLNNERGEAVVSVQLQDEEGRSSNALDAKIRLL